MSYENLPIRDCWIYKPEKHRDERGEFFEWFQGDEFLTQTGYGFNVRQANCSISREGVIRGIHFAAYPPGQGKIISCLTGSVLDIIVDLRPNSETYLSWEAIEISAKNGWVISIPAGIGHGYLSLEENTVVSYLCDQTYSPDNEFGINPFDPLIGIHWPSRENKEPFIVSARDREAPDVVHVSHVISGFIEIKP